MVKDRRISVMLLVCLTFVLVGAAIGQHSAPLSLEAILNGSAERRETYINEFKNLLSEETKTFSIYDKKGAVKKTRTITSTFIVYQLSKNEKSIAEFRNVTAIDGKKV